MACKEKYIFSNVSLGLDLSFHLHPRHSARPSHSVLLLPSLCCRVQFCVTSTIKIVHSFLNQPQALDVTFKTKDFIFVCVCLSDVIEIEHRGSSGEQGGSSGYSSS